MANVPLIDRSMQLCSAVEANGSQRGGKKSISLFILIINPLFAEYATTDSHLKFCAINGNVLLILVQNK